MGYVHMHQRILAIEGCGSPNCVQDTMEKTKEDNWKARKIGQIISQVFAPKLKYDKIWAQWVLDIVSKSKRVWWCKCFELKS
jgi:hypothetical protein